MSLLSRFLDVDRVQKTDAFAALEGALVKIQRSGLPYPWDYTIVNFHRFYRETTAALSILRAAHGSRIIEAGCGNCLVAMALSELGYQVTTVDRAVYTQTPMLEARRIASDIFGVKDVVASFADSKVDQLVNGCCDVVTCFDVIEHLPGSPRSMLDEFWRWLVDGGHLVIGTPNMAMWYMRLRFLLGRSPHSAIEHWYRAPQPYDGHYREYTIKELAWVTRESGYEILQCRYYDEHNKVFWRWDGERLQLRRASQFVSDRPACNLGRIAYWSGGRVFASMRDTIEVVARKPCSLVAKP